MRWIRSGSMKCTKSWAKCLQSCSPSFKSQRLRNSMIIARNSSGSMWLTSKIIMESFSTRLLSSNTVIIFTKSNRTKMQRKPTKFVLKSVRKMSSTAVWLMPWLTYRFAKENSPIWMRLSKILKTPFRFTRISRSMMKESIDITCFWRS